MDILGPLGNIGEAKSNQQGADLAWGPEEGRGKTLVAVIKSKLPQGN